MRYKGSAAHVGGRRRAFSRGARASVTRFGPVRRHGTRARPVLLLLAALAACWSESAPSAEPEPSGSTQADAEVAPRTVALSPSLGELIVAIGAADALVGRTDFDVHPDIAPLPSVGGGLDPDLERLVALGVERVVAPATRDAPALATRLADLGIDWLGIRTESVQDIHAAIDILGRQYGRQVQADALRAQINAELAAVREHVEGRPPVRVFYVVWDDPPMTTGAGTFVNELITLAGGHNVFADADALWPNVSFEALVARAPDVIVWPQDPDAPRSLDALRQRPGWRELDAVQRGAVHFVDADLFNQPGPRVPEAADLLARLLHPEAF